MSYNPRDYHLDARTVVFGFLLVAIVFCGMGVASLDLPGTVQNGWNAMAGERHSGTTIQCL